MFGNPKISKFAVGLFAAISFAGVQLAHAQVAETFPLQLKPGADVTAINEVFYLAAPAIKDSFKFCADREPVVTSGNDSKHREGSWHYQNLAIDLRAKGLALPVLQCLQTELTKRLPRLEHGRFVVLLETFGADSPRNHFHLHFIPAEIGPVLAAG